MTLSYMVLYVKDMDKSLALYKDVLGLEMTTRYPTETGGEAAFLVEPGFKPMIDQPLLELVVDPAGNHNAPAAFLLGFEVKDLAAASSAVEKLGLKKLKGPYSPDNSVQISTFSGPDRELFELMQF